MSKRYLKYNNQLVSLDGKLVEVDVDSVSKISEEKTVIPTTTQQIITPSDSDHELSTVTVEAIQTEEKTATSNGDVTPTSGKFLSKVTVNVPTSEASSLQEKTVTPSTSQQEITPDSGYDGLSKVIVEAVTNDIDSNIIASNIKKDVSILGVTGTLETNDISITYDESSGTLTITDVAG